MSRDPANGASLDTTNDLTDSPEERERVSLLDRLRAIDGVQWAVFAIFLASLVAHLWNVGPRAYHHDESQHAAFSYYFAAGNGYRHDPLLHGPLQFHVIAVIFKLFGDSDFTARIFQAVAGSVLVLTPLLLRRKLGNTGTILVRSSSSCRRPCCTTRGLRATNSRSPCSP